MKINWFPGHMHRARTEIHGAMRSVKLVIEVLDARLPFSSENPLVPQLRGSTPVLKVLNKMDLADKKQTKKWLEYFRAQEGVSAITIKGDTQTGCKELLRTGKMLVRGENIDKMSNVMILGVPNVGKSTIINSLAGRDVCNTENRPAVTTSQQRIRISENITLVDTPGFLWPKLEPEICGVRLAMSGAVSPKCYSYVAVAEYLASYLLESKYYSKMADFYALQHKPEHPGELFHRIAQRRGFMMKGKRLNVDGGAEALVHDFRRAAFGGVTLETPEMILAEGGIEGKEEGVRGKEGRLERKAEKKRQKRIQLENLKHGIVDTPET
mmetsp:Transcript_925/g.1473  ORF Transcript_925/g.1473 Transcript_925/m.1473 type:complete len:325 (-) Transcript_925:119-1093(-)